MEDQQKQPTLRALKEARRMSTEHHGEEIDSSILNSLRKWAAENHSRVMVRPWRTEKGRIRAQVRILSAPQIAEPGTIAILAYARSRKEWKVLELQIYVPEDHIAPHPKEQND